jgi:DNA-3-methyladenine glycosylase I
VSDILRIQQSGVKIQEQNRPQFYILTRHGVANMPTKRCPWTGNDALMIEYHDTEWGVPLHEDPKIYEFLVLEGMQAGLSWSTVLRKRESFRAAFRGFDPALVAGFVTRDIERLLSDPGIIRNRLKIEAAVTNAACFLAVQKEFGSFDKYIWEFIGGRPVRHRFQDISEIPPTSAESDRISKDLKQRGFKFVGSTIVYAHMQATGMVNDHLVGCFRYKQV